MDRDDDASLDFALSDLVRALGLHRPDRTPCGQPFSPSEAMTLLLLDDRGEVPQRDLAAALDLEKSTVSRLVDALVRRGLLQRSPHPEGGRSRVVALTEEGAQKVLALRVARRQRLDRLLEVIPSEDRAAVVKVIHQLTEAGHATR
ncbi:MAG: MarR family transcriptional regulator [Nocardioides sp.]